MNTPLTVNGQRQRVQSNRDTPLLWVLRDELGLTGSKFGCGVGQCGACQSAALMAAAALLQQTPEPDDAQIAAALGNLCRCGTYPRMVAAVRATSSALRQPAQQRSRHPVPGAEVAELDGLLTGAPAGPRFRPVAVDADRSLPSR